MPTFRDWPRTLQRASFRGVSFHVDKDTIEGEARRIIVHEFPLGEAPYLEDNGRESAKIHVTAYLVSDEVDDREKELRQACAQRGPGSLVLPMERLTVRCEGCRRDATKDRLGFVAFDLKFIREGLGSFPLSVMAGGRLVESLAEGIAAPLAALAPLFQGLRVASFVSESAVAAVRDLASALEAARLTLPLVPATAPALARTIQDLWDDAPALVAAGDRGDRFGDRHYVALAERASAAPLIARIVAPVGELRLAAQDRVQARSALRALAGTGDDWPAIRQSTPSRRIEAQNRALMLAAFRASVLANHAAAVALADYADRRSAIAARAEVAELIDAELDRLSAFGSQLHAAWEALAELRGRTVELLSGTIASLAPVLTVGAPNRMPALWWANRLYADAARAGEIAARNRIKHPAFMPTEFEALSR